MILDYFNDRKPLAIGLSFVVILDLLDWSSTYVALRLPEKDGFIFGESNWITANWMSMGTGMWLLNCVGVTLFILGCITMYWRYLETKHPERIQYFLFLVSLSTSLLTATVVNNLRLLVMYAVT